MADIVGVLIVGAGASGAAVAWSLADTRMRILCLEQGDWTNPSDYPSTGRGWEARQFDDFAISPNRRAHPADYPINDDNSPIKIVNFNGVGGGEFGAPALVMGPGKANPLYPAPAAAAADAAILDSARRLAGLGCGRAPIRRGARP